MKKIVMVWVMAAFMIGLVNPAMAMMRKDMETMRGKVIAVNLSTNEVTVRQDGTGLEKTFRVRKGVDPSLTQGSSVVVIFKRGSNVANSLKPVKKKY